MRNFDLPYDELWAAIGPPATLQKRALDVERSSCHELGWGVADFQF